MNAKAAEIRSQVLALSESERAELVIDILDSLDDRAVEADQDELARVWAEETARRAAQIDAGEVATVSWDTVLDRVAATRRER